MKHLNVVPNRYSQTPDVSLIDQRGDLSLFVDFRVVETYASRRSYTVKSGDTLQSIASAVYGYPEMWFAIYEHNLDLLEHPDDVDQLVGSTIKLPSTNAGDY